MKSLARDHTAGPEARVLSLALVAPGLARLRLQWREGRPVTGLGFGERPC